MKNIAVIRLKGKIGLSRPVRDTLKLLRLYKVNYCTVIPATKEYAGMLKTIKDVVTWGEIDEKTFKSLIEKRGRIVGNKQLTTDYIKDKTKLEIEEFVKELMEGKKKLRDVPGVKPFFRLKPPEGGFERKGIKKPYSMGGSLGYRKDKINDLIMRML